MNNKIKFLRGTSDEYAVAEKDSDTIYFTTDDGKLYIGDKEVSGSDVTIDDTLSDTSENAVQNKVIKSYVDNSLANIQTALSGKVDKEEGKSLISDSEITRLANVKNYDDTKVKSDISSMNVAINANKTNIANIQAEIGDMETVLSSVVEVTE